MSPFCDRLRLFAVAALGALAACATPPAPVHATGEAPATHRDDEAPVARTTRFEFRSRFVYNLHDRLLQWGVSDDRTGASCIATLPTAERAGWERGVAAFGALRPEVAPRGLALRLRYELYRPGDPVFDRIAKVPEWYRPALAAAGPAYRRCFWADDDRKNREWIHSLAARLARAETKIATRIEQAHHVTFDAERIPVDVVPNVSFEGAWTVVHPDHILISSTGPGYLGVDALETIFHEASHTIVSPRSDGSVAALRAAAEKEGIELHRDLWHVVLFFTAGDAAKKAIAEAWDQPYVQYLYAQGLFTRAWPELREPMEKIWQAYLDGKTTLDDAARQLVVATGKKR